MKGRTIALCFLLIALAMPAMGQWVKTNGPEGGYAGLVFSDAASGRIFVGGNGLYRSSDNGATWQESNAGMTGDASPVGMVRAGSKLYAVSLSQLYISTDDGSSWSLSAASIPAQALSVTAIGNIIVVGTNVYGTYRTTDDGATWTQGTGFQPFNNIAQTFVVTGSRILAGLGGKRIWSSNDSGKSWAQFGSGTLFGASHTVGSLVLHAGKIYGACSDSGVFVSTDAGATWAQTSTGMNPRAEVSKVISNGTDLYALVLGAYTGTDTGLVYRSTNNGATWFSVKSDLPGASGLNLGFGTGKVLFSTVAGVYASTDNGGHWSWSNTGMDNVNGSVLAVHGSTLFAGYAGGVAKTIDGGTTWTLANTGLPKGAGAGGLTVHGAYIFASIGDGITGVVRSSNDGASWTTTNNGLTGFALYTGVMASGASSVYAGTFNGIYVSVNDGGTWTGPGTGLAFGNPSAIFVNGTDIWAGMGSNGVYLSTDNGSTWSPMNTGLPAFGKNVTAITTSGSTLILGLSSVSGPSIYISTDNGANWTASSSGIPAANTVTALYTTGSSIFAGSSGESAAIFMSSDNGASWSSASQGLPAPSSITAIAIIGSEMYGSALGVWKRPLSGASTTDITVQTSWNMLSVPRTLSDYTKSSVFPTSSSGAFLYGPSGYIAAETLKGGIGYWLKFSSTQTVSVSGQAMAGDTISVNAGWNLIGSITSPVPVANVASIPGGIVTSSFFAYGVSYTAADTILPGYAYWVKANQGGQLVLRSSSSFPTTRIRIVPAQELPPSPQQSLEVKSK